MRNKLIVGSALTCGWLVLGAGPALGHGQMVQPPSHEAPIVSGSISRGWAQAHCNSAAPAVHAQHTVVRFTPAEALPCPTEAANPGGQVHPHAVEAP